MQVAGDIRYEFTEEQQTKVDYHYLKKSLNGEEILLYLQNCDDKEKQKLLDNIFEQSKLENNAYQQLLADRSFCISLL